jgi:hypothetical protein
LSRSKAARCGNAANSPKMRVRGCREHLLELEHFDIRVILPYVPSASKVGQLRNTELPTHYIIRAIREKLLSWWSALFVG